MSLLNKAVSGAYNKVSKLNDLLNGPDPRFVSYRENGKDKKIENLNLDANHCHSFIGKMKADGKGTYSDEVITALLKYFIDHTQKGEKIVIELANAVSEIMNGEESMEGYLSFEQQKEHMLKLAKELNKKRVSDVEIVDIQDNNKRLFEALRGGEGAESFSKVAGKPNVGTVIDYNFSKIFFDLSGKFDSFDIAQHLYAVAILNPQYLQKMKEVKSGELKKTDGNSDFYSIVEIAIRINALLHGVDVQGGIARQKKYDDLLLMHLNPHIKTFPELQFFQQFCWEYLKGQTFKGLYFDTKESIQYLNKIKKKDFLSKIRSGIYIALAAGTGVLGNAGYMKYNNQQKEKELFAKQKQEIFEDKKIVISGYPGSHKVEGKEKVETIDRWEDAIYERFLTRYGSIGKFTEAQFRGKIINILNDENILSKMGRASYIMSEPSREDRFIDDYFIPKYRAEFNINNVPILPFQNLVPYTDLFIQTMNRTDTVEFELLHGKIQNLVINGQPSNEKIQIKKLGSFAEKNEQYYGNSTVDLYLVTYKIDNEWRQIVCSNRYYRNPEEAEPVNSIRAQEILPDFFEQAFPMVPALFDEYLFRYYKIHTNQWDWYEGPVKEKMRYGVGNFLIKDFFGKRLDKEISANDGGTIREYLDEIMIQHGEELKQFLGDDEVEKNPNLVPNGYREEYEEAMRNSMNAPSGLKRLPVAFPGEPNTSVRRLGEYKASDGKIYKVGIVEINGENYLYGDDTSYNYVGSEETYGPYEGNKIAEDYFKVKEEFQKKKAEREQQQRLAE